MMLARVAALMAAGLLSVSDARADDKASVCIDANSAAQDARSTGQFERARGALKECMAVTCPQLIRDDCTERWEELQKAQPTVILSAQDGSGTDLDAVSVTIDGRPLLSKLDGVGVRVDPGTHEFQFTRAGSVPQVLRAVIKEGEHARPIAAVFVGPAMQAERSPAAGRTTKAGAWQTVGVVGVALGGGSIAVGATFGVLALRSKSTEDGHCGSGLNAGAPPGACDATGVAASQAASTRAAVSTAFLVAGAALGVGGVVLYLAAPKAPRVELGLGSVSVAGAF